MHILSRTAAVFAATALLFSCSSPVEDPNSLTYHFASVEEGRQIISTSDAFTQSLHGFDLQSRLQDAGLEPTEENYLKLGYDSVLDWTEEEIEAVNGAARRIQARIDSCGYRLPLPEDITLIKTTMAEEGGAGGYTRGTCIFLASFEGLPVERQIMLDYILSHELFHILSRHSPEFRKAMYAQIGFEILDHEIEFSDELLEMRISNPDVASYDSYSLFEIDGRKVPCTMWFYNDREYVGGPFFRYGKPGLIELDGDFRPVMAPDGSPLIYDPEKVTGFYDRIGKNTDYVINPEEALADNFAFALLDFFPQGNPSPEVTERLREVMRGLE